MEFGGNTSCVSVEAGGQFIILDAGSGIHFLGRELMRRALPAATLLISHSHMDHILGYPFFAPAWRDSFHLKIMAGHRTGVGGIRPVFELMMSDPVFPVALTSMGKSAVFEDFQPGATFNLGPDVLVSTFPLNHPNGCMGYRIEAEGRVVSYITDTEHVVGQTDPNVAALMRDADLAIYDTTYTEAEFKDRVGWGHSTWQEGVRVARFSNAKRLALFHHDPSHDDAFMARIEAEAAATWPGAFAAREGTVITL